jgi:hypothetical protein
MTAGWSKYCELGQRWNVLFKPDHQVTVEEQLLA